MMRRVAFEYKKFVVKEVAKDEEKHGGKIMLGIMEYNSFTEDMVIDRDDWKTRIYVTDPIIKCPIYFFNLLFVCCYILFGLFFLV